MWLIKKHCTHPNIHLYINLHTYIYTQAAACLTMTTLPGKCARLLRRLENCDKFDISFYIVESVYNTCTIEMLLHS